MSFPILLLVCALLVWPSGIASIRLGQFSRGRAADRPGLLVRVRGIPAVRFLLALWWVPAGAIALVHPGVGFTALIAGAGLRAALRARGLRVRERAHTTAAQAALAAVVDELRVGAHPAHAFAAAAEECAAAVGAHAQSGQSSVAQTMREVAARAHLGGNVAEGLRQRAKAVRHGGALWARLASCWELSHDDGVPMAEAVGALRADLVERTRFASRTEAALAGARSTAKILAGLPVFAAGFGQVMGADPAGVLFRGPGSALLLLGCGLICAGLAWSRRITEGAVQ